MKKVIAASEAVAQIGEGAVLMVGGFMGVGTPQRLIDELVRQQKKNLTLIANDAASPTTGVGRLIAAGLVTRLIASHIGLNPEAQHAMLEKRLSIELVPQGTLIERIRSGGFGLGGVLTTTGVGTTVAEGKRIIEIDGTPYLLELPLRADFALVGAKHADYFGNLDYAMTARNFNPLIAMAATTVFAEADEIVPVGSIAPDHVVTPSVVVDYLIAKEQRRG